MIVIINLIEVRLLVLDKMEKTHFSLYALLCVIIKPLNIIQQTDVRRLWKVEWRGILIGDLGTSVTRNELPTLSFCLPYISGWALEKPLTWKCQKTLTKKFPQSLLSTTRKDQKVGGLAGWQYFWKHSPYCSPALWRTPCPLPSLPWGAGRDRVGSLDFQFHLGAAHGKVAGSSPIPLQPGWCHQRLGVKFGLLNSHLKLHSSPYQLEEGGFGEEWAGEGISLNL